MTKNKSQINLNIQIQSMTTLVFGVCILFGSCDLLFDAFKQ